MFHTRSALNCRATTRLLPGYRLVSMGWLAAGTKLGGKEAMLPIVRLLLGLLALLAAGTASAQTPPQEPFLRIEAGGHIGAVPHLAVDASGRLLATAGYEIGRAHV